VFDLGRPELLELTGTYTLRHGTGIYAGARGSGTYSGKGTFVERHTATGCSDEPISAVLVRLDGTTTLP